MSRRLAAVLAAVTLAGVAACGSEGSSGQAGAGATTGGGGAAGGPRLALVMSHQTNAFTTAFSQAAKDEATKLGADLTVLDARKDTATQVTLVETAVTQGYAGIMVEPVAVDGLDRAAIAARDADIPLITVVQKMSNQDLAKSFVGGDDEAAGKMQMENTLKLINGKGKIAVLYGPMGSDAQLIRKKGYDAVLAQNTGVSVAFQNTANWVTDEALKQADNWLGTGTQLAAIVAQNDSMALGAARAAENAGQKVVVTGIDATPEGLEAVRAGQIVGTVSQDTTGMGRLAVQTMLKVVKGETVEKEIKTKPVWITKENAGS